MSVKETKNEKLQRWPILWRIGLGPVLAMAFGIVVTKNRDSFYSMLERIGGITDHETADLIGVSVMGLIAISFTSVLSFFYIRKTKSVMRNV
jgi:hypothetical protein